MLWRAGSLQLLRFGVKGFLSNHNRIDGGGLSRDHPRQTARTSEGPMIQVCVEQALKGGEEGRRVSKV